MAEALRELDGINAWLRGHRISLGLLRRRLESAEGPVQLLDVGAGGAGTSRFLAHWARRHGIELEVTLVDLHSAVCQVAQKTIRNEPGCRLVRADAFRLPFEDHAFHFAHAALFLHHFPHVEILRLLEEMQRVTSGGLVVNDLHRHPLAFHAIRAIGRIFIRSPIVRHDAPLSVRRGFRAEDLERWCLDKPGFRLGYRRRWPFRWAAWAFSDGGTPERVGRRMGERV
jgi:2-polyprenyl-3-methyl-5-hydroxy-6-metoxy-1,4-benzoquinol methylase